ncbi:MAG: ABC transporter ATP-binding protein, partial [Anaerolineae bacterium]|nr:ABC transporter ATP-binding protein [Anaerolineae bacterium]
MEWHSVKTSIARYLELLGRYLGPHRLKAGALGALLLGSTGLQLISPQIVRGFIDAAQAQADSGRLALAALAFLGVGLANQGFSLMVAYLSNDVGWLATNELRADLVAHCLSLDMPFHKAHTPGTMIERIDGDVLSLANFFSQFVVRLLGSALMLLGILVVLFLEDWRVGAGLALFALASLVMLAKVRSFAVGASADEREASANLFGFIEERLIGLDDIRANGAGAYAMRRFHQVVRDFTSLTVRAWMRRSVIWVLSMGLFGAGRVLALGLGAALYLSGAFTIGTVYLVSYYMLMLFRPIEQLTQQLQDLQKAVASIGRVTELLQSERTILDGSGAPLPDGALGLDFDGVSFIYEDGDEPVLTELSFRLEPGRKLGLLGRTGCGKTTLSRLLFRLYDPSAGAVRLSGREVKGLRLEDLRRRVGIVTQDVQLFQATVRDNLTLFDRTVPEERLLGVIKDLCLSQWLASLPQGLDTRLGAGGRGLSAGEAQVLALARVFLRDPGLVIMDEPSSRLDPATEAMVERGIERLLQGRTAIIIAHRLATVQR